jgi:hypothetical protein
MQARCSCGWEALTGDPLPWLLDESRPNLHWRVLVELVGRPLASPAVERARGGASAAGPIAALLGELHPDGNWASDETRWKPFSGPGWRLVAAVLWGADPGDPRLHAACDLVLDTNPGLGGFAIQDGDPPLGPLTARFVQALAELGYSHQPRFQEAVAWLEEDDEPWGVGPDRLQLAVAVLATIAGRPSLRRNRLRERAAEVALEELARGKSDLDLLGHPNLSRSDSAEALWALARAGVPFRSEIGCQLRRLQALQIEGGRWPRRIAVPESLPLATYDRPEVDRPSRWITLRAVVAMNAYAVDAELPRLFPSRP